MAITKKYLARQYIILEIAGKKVVYPTMLIAGPGIVALITGTVDNATEAQIVAAVSRTIIITLEGDTWIAAGTGPIGTTAESQAIIDGITSAQTETLGWNNEVRDTMSVSRLVRTSSTVATITLNSSETTDYKIVADEVITVTVPAAVLVISADALIGNQTLDIVAECDQTLAPGTIATQTNLSGVVGDIDESVDAPDGNWLILSPP